jgi:hypothetical protein
MSLRAKRGNLYQRLCNLPEIASYLAMTKNSFSVSLCLCVSVSLCLCVSVSLR